VSKGGPFLVMVLASGSSTRSPGMPSRRALPRHARVAGDPPCGCSRLPGRPDSDARTRAGAARNVRARDWPEAGAGGEPSQETNERCVRYNAARTGRLIVSLRLPSPATTRDGRSLTILAGCGVSAPVLVLLPEPFPGQRTRLVGDPEPVKLLL
jgi:hypothetical protein